VARQFVVQLDNRPGELAHLARALAARGIDIRHIGGVGAGDLGCAFITTSDDEATREVLHGLGHPSSRVPPYSWRCRTGPAAWPTLRNGSPLPASTSAGP
jgi:hypothetical protein